MIKSSLPSPCASDFLLTGQQRSNKQFVSWVLLGWTNDKTASPPFIDAIFSACSSRKIQHSVKLHPGPGLGKNWSLLHIISLM